MREKEREGGKEALRFLITCKRGWISKDDDSGGGSLIFGALYSSFSHSSSSSRIILVSSRRIKNFREIFRPFGLLMSNFPDKGEGTLPWATPYLGPSRFFNEKKINIFRLMHIALFIKMTYWRQILLKKIHILYCFTWKVMFSMRKVNFWMFGFIETKTLNIDSFTNENWYKFKCHRS